MARDDIWTAIADGDECGEEKLEIMLWQKENSLSKALNYYRRNAFIGREHH